MKIILVRHGETNWNLYNKYQGHRDIALNDTGRKQAHEIALRLKNDNIEAIYCSDLSRTLETASIIAEYFKLPVNVDPRLREMSFGEWEGLTFTEVYARYPEEYEDWYRNTGTFKIPGGESPGELLERVWPALLEITRRHAGTILVSTHGGVLRSLLHHIQGDREHLWRDGLGNGSIVQIIINDEDIKILE